MTNPARNACCAAMILGLVGCSASTPADRSIAAAPMITLFEGLPRPDTEPDAFKAAKDGTVPVIERGEYSFYEEPLRLNTEEQATLRRILGDPKTYTKWAGEKKCGGFHPDYAVEWQDGDHMRTTMICFTCSELKVRGPDGEHRYDITPAAREPLRALLGDRRKHRPASKGGPG